MLAEKRTDRGLPNAWGGQMDAGDWDRNSRHPAARWWLVDLYELFPNRIGKLKLALPLAEATNAIPDILESYWDIYTVPSSNEYIIHQTIIPTAYYWGFLAARK